MLKVIDNQFNFLGAVDEYNSFIATRSYFNIGGFELHLTFSKDNSLMLQEENIIFKTPDKPYIILHREINADTNKMTIKGEELKHYISRWITKPPSNQAYHRINANAETIMKEYVLTNCKTPNLIVAPNLERGDKIVFQTRYKQLSDELAKVGLATGTGWTVRLDLINNKFVFDILQGVDRKASQSLNSRAIFASDFDNVRGQTLTESKIGYKNIAYVAGQGQGANRKIVEVGQAEGFDRFETFVDANDIENEEDLPDRGLQKLSELQKVKAFESEILAQSNLIYEEDYDLGDVVTIQNKEWQETMDTIIENITEIYEPSGFKLEADFGKSLPTFAQVLNQKLDKPIAEATGGGDGYPVGNITNFEAKGDDTTVELTWQDPPNVTITDSLDNLITIARWKGTKILRKVGSFPQNENDGVLVVDSGVRNQYETVGFVDTGLVNDTDYYYMAFPYTEEDVFTVDEANRVVGTPSDVDDKTGSPGSAKLIAGDMTAGYFGVVPASELFTGAEISSECGITQGTLQFSDVGWLKFAIDGEIIFKSQKTYRHSISWDYINGVGAVKGTKQVSKGGINYKVTLLKGALTDPSVDVGGDRGAKGSEWNRLMLPIHIKAKDKSWAYPEYVESDVPYWGIDFTDVDLQTHNSAGNGSYQWCQEVYGPDASYRVTRGLNGVSFSGYETSSGTYSYYGWSPVLRVVK